MTKYLWGYLACFLILGCGENNIDVDILISPTSVTNPMADVAAAYQVSQSSGLFFSFDPLVPNPSGISAIVGGNTVGYPSSSSIGINPAQDTFTIDPSILTEGVYYRMSLFARDLTGTITHSGIGDCPIFVGTNQTVKICFAQGSSPQNNCPGVTAFTCCEGIGQGC